MSRADELARRVADTLLAREGTGPAWGVDIEDAREGYARVAMTLREEMLNGHGSAHGGMVFALADTAFAYACNSRNAARAGERLIAEAREQAAAGRSGLYYVTVTGPEGRVVAEFQGLGRTVGGAVVQES